MKKIYLTAAIVAAMSTSFVACTNELDVPVETTVAEGQTGRIVFSVRTGTRGGGIEPGGVVAEDQKLERLSVYIFDAAGVPVQGFKGEYTKADLTDGKLAVSLPSDLMSKTGLKAYLLANVGYAVFGSEAVFLNITIPRLLSEVPDKGIPMVSGPISLDTSTPIIAAEAVMKRTLSSLLVKVNAVEHSGVTVNAGDFTYKVKNVRTDKGYMFKDEVVSGEVTTEATWTPKANTNVEEMLGYMYQSDGFEVEITPSVDKPELGSTSRTVVVSADKAKFRNKKYVLNVLPTVSGTGTIDFTVTVEDWDATDGNFDVDWNDRFAVKTTGLPATVTYDAASKGIKIDGSIIPNVFAYTGLSCSATELLDLTENTTLRKVEERLKGGVEVTENVNLILGDIPVGTTLGYLDFITNNNGVLAKQEVLTTLVGPKAKFKYNGTFDDGDEIVSFPLGTCRLTTTLTGQYESFIFTDSPVYYLIDPDYEFIKSALSRPGDKEMASCGMYAAPEMIGGQALATCGSVETYTVSERPAIRIKKNGTGTGYFRICVHLRKKSDNTETFQNLSVKCVVN